MPSLDITSWAALTAGLIALFYYIKGQLAAGKVSELKAQLEKLGNATTNAAIDDLLKTLSEQSRTAQSDYEAEKAKLKAGDPGFVGPKPGNS